MGLTCSSRTGPLYWRQGRAGLRTFPLPAVDDAGQDQVRQLQVLICSHSSRAGVDSAPSARKNVTGQGMESFDLDHTTPDPGVVGERLSNRLPFVDEPLGPVLYWCLAFEGV